MSIIDWFRKRQEPAAAGPGIDKDELTRVIAELERLKGVINRHEALIYKRKRNNDLPNIEPEHTDNGSSDISWLQDVK